MNQATKKSVFLNHLCTCAFLVLWNAHSVQAMPPGPEASQDITETDPQAAAAQEGQLLSSPRQLTFEGRRAGEGYFSRDGRKMVFQSERETGNPFFQIYLLDLETGDIERVSPGRGKTTCAWIHPDGDQVLFASTHEDPEAKAKQEEEIELRQSGQERRYSWDYDENFDVYAWRQGGETYENLTKTRGYDAEGSWSPDGSLIAFASNRQAYEGPLDDETKKAFEIDPAYLNEIYIMRSDGSDVRRLTQTPGYDGGPFFSPDGQRICWRRFTPNGAIAEIMTMNIDGSDQRQLTRLGAMSWAPYYHPSGRYLIFTTNRHGFANFELYMVDAEGKSQPVRVTYTKGFDGLPVFTPDGKSLAWTSNRTASKQSQLFLAQWNHERALQSLGLSEDAVSDAETVAATTAGVDASRQTTVEFAPEDIMRHVDYLCRPELEGRLTGTPGEKMATAYVAAYLDSLGLEPAGDNGSWYQEFEFTSGIALGDNNAMSWGDKPYTLNEDWVPVSFSETGQFEAAPVVFAGYGIIAPEAEDQAEYDSFVHLDVEDQWVIALRYLPEQVSPERRQHLSRYASLRYKAMLVRDRGARGLILVSGPNSQVKEPLVKLRFDGTLSGTSIPVLSVTDELVDQWLAASGKTLKQLQESLDSGEPVMGFPVKDIQLSASVAIQQVKRQGRNVIARLPAGPQPSSQTIVVGAHIDHLGKGVSSSSLARDDEKEAIHFGADDNASGVAAMLEIAEFLVAQRAQGRMPQRRDILLAAWSGEELGLVGSSHFVKTFSSGTATHGASSAASQPASLPAGAAHGKPATPHAHANPRESETLYPAIAACLNLDMVGRLDKRLVLQGVGSSSIWREEIERRNVPVGLPITLQEDSYLPTDASSFYLRGVPILSAFTGSHSEYHTPRDTPDTLNYEGAAKVSRLMALIARSLAVREETPEYIAQTAPRQGQQRAGLRAYLGTIPDYAEADIKGVKLSGVAATGPCAKAGVRGGDVIVGLAGKKIENIYDYTYAIEALKIGQPVKITVTRGEKRIELTVTPGSRD